MTTKTKTGERDLAAILLERHRKREADTRLEREFYSKCILRKASGESLGESEDECLEITAGILGRELKIDLGQALHVRKLETKWLGGLDPDSAELRAVCDGLYAEAKAKAVEATELEQKAKALRQEAEQTVNRGRTIESAAVDVKRLRESLEIIFGGQP